MSGEDDTTKGPSKRRGIPPKQKSQSEITAPYLDFDLEPFTLESVAEICDRAKLKLDKTQGPELRDSLNAQAQLYDFNFRMAQYPSQKNTREFFEKLSKRLNKLLADCPLEYPQDPLQADNQPGAWATLDFQESLALEIAKTPDERRPEVVDEFLRNSTLPQDLAAHSSSKKSEHSETSSIPNHVSKSVLSEFVLLGEIISGAAKRELARPKETEKVPPRPMFVLCEELCAVYERTFASPPTSYNPRQIDDSRDQLQKYGPTVRFLSLCCEAIDAESAPSRATINDWIAQVTAAKA